MSWQKQICVRGQSAAGLEFADSGQSTSQCPALDEPARLTAPASRSLRKWHFTPLTVSPRRSAITGWVIPGSALSIARGSPRIGSVLRLIFGAVLVQFWCNLWCSSWPFGGFLVVIRRLIPFNRDSLASPRRQPCRRRRRAVRRLWRPIQPFGRPRVSARLEPPPIAESPCTIPSSSRSSPIAAWSRF